MTSKENSELAKDCFIESTRGLAASNSKALFAISAAMILKPDLYIDLYLKGLSELVWKCAAEIEGVGETAETLGKGQS